MTMIKAKLMMERMGWYSGKGLGKNETGITKAIRPDYQTTKIGLGYDAKKDELWWERQFNEAAKNINVEVKETGKEPRKIDVPIVKKSTGKVKKRKHKSQKKSINNVNPEKHELVSRKMFGKYVKSIKK